MLLVLLGSFPFANAQFELKRSSLNLLDQRRAGASAVLDGNGGVASITVRGGGSGYTPATARVTLTAPLGGGVTAAATAVVNGGVITGFTITNPGSGYGSTPPEVFIAPPQAAVGDPVTTAQFAGMAAIAASAGPLNQEPGGVVGPGGTAQYPSAQDLTSASQPVVTMVLKSATYGYAFAAGVPRYSMGDVITPPVIGFNGAPVPEGYWRSRPVQPGEIFASGELRSGDPETGSIVPQPVLPEGSVTVVSASTTSQLVTVSSVPVALTSGAVLLGQKVGMINGNVVTLIGPANKNISGSGQVERFSPYLPYYYSPHADKVFATQPGQVTITWVSSSPDTLRTGETAPSYKFRRETFNVSSGTNVPVRTIYWTETSKGFNGPIVSIPAGRISRVNPVYNNSVPAMTTEYVPVGGNTNPSPNVNPAPETRTLWFDNQSGQPSLRSHNLEGRLFVEYLGNQSNSTAGTLEFLGADIVEIQQVAEVETLEVSLGEKLRPRRMQEFQNGDDQLVPRMMIQSTQGQILYGSYVRPDGNTDYYAERENLNPDLITIHWMEFNDAAIRFSSPTSPTLDIVWPKYKRSYIQTWPRGLNAYEPVNVLSSGVDANTGPKFDANNLPQLIYQDDPQENEAVVDAATQRLIVDFSNSVDKTNRSLLKFGSTGEPWYVRLYIQSQDVLGSPEIPAVPDPDGPGPLTGRDAIPAVYTLNDLNGDGEPDLSLQATVGTRIDPPPGYALAGFISSGRCFSEAAYRNPLANEGVEAAASGGIIPVNALPNQRDLKVWWFKKVVPPDKRFAPFYLPAVSARYRVSYPSSPQELVIASGKGVENPGLTSVQAQGSIYVQNDPSLIGYNPNEEHALMVQGNAYALRTDLNRPDSSEPFVLIQYTEPASGDTPARPAMRALKVVPSNELYPFSYNAIAGTQVQPPMPLTVLPLPLKADGTVRNVEVPGTPDPAPAASLPVAFSNYDRFTFEDRKGYHWTYRGPHSGGSPNFGMKFYYYLREGFHFPALQQQPPVGSIQPFIRDTGAGVAETLTYSPMWPDDESLPVADRRILGELRTAETLALSKAGLPQVRGQSSAQVVYQQSIAMGGAAKESVALHDPTRAKMTLLKDGRLAKLPGSILTTEYSGKTYFQNVSPHLQNRFYFDPAQGGQGALVLKGEFVDEVVGEDYFNLNQLSEQDVADLKGLCPESDRENKSNWNTAIDALVTSMETFRESPTVPGKFVPTTKHDIAVKQRADVADPDTAVDSYALSSTGNGTGYVTLVFGNGKAFTEAGDPVTMQVIKVVPKLYPGDLKVLLSSNPLDEQVVLRHSGDYGGEAGNFEFEWRYGFSSNGLAPEGNPTNSAAWINPRADSPGMGSSILVGGSPSAVISTPAVLMGDTWFTMRYRLKGATEYSDWTAPALVEGWIKRVLAKINPFNQRMENLYSNAVNTDVSLLTQAGKRWEGDIALNLNNVNDAGLIEIYETVLNRGRSFTLNSDIDLGSSNNALILAAGYLNDLYNILGNEAFADAANPTISVDDQTTVTEVNTSRFSFESQVASSLEEELGLLRGRDDFGSPSVALAPAYNRLWWNYTRGIDSGEALYAVNYNIREKAGSNTANGKVDAADAQRMFPQGHGDAYGHYLTALKGYYKLLTHPSFTWVPQAESVTVLGQAVLVDYKDERKFAASASRLTATAQQVLALVHRQNYQDNPAAGWGNFRDGKVNSRTGVKRHQGLDEVASRSCQGAFFNWVVANALLPDKDTNPNHTGVQIVDRTTVPEINEIVTSAKSFQNTMDLANGHLNPLGLSPGAIAFDISPTEHQAGNSHYEQIYGRSLRTLLNAKGAFDQAAKMTRLLRNQENQIAKQQEAIEDEEYAMLNRLKEIYGTPYAGDIGPGKSYEQGYNGPDLLNWAIIDRPTDLVDTSKSIPIKMRVPTDFKLSSLTDINSVYQSFTSGSVERTFHIVPNQRVQFAQTFSPNTVMGKREQTGALQQALMDAYLKQVALVGAGGDLQDLQCRFEREKELYLSVVESNRRQLAAVATFGASTVATQTAAVVMKNMAEKAKLVEETIVKTANAMKEALPRSVGFSNDVTSVGRSAFMVVSNGTSLGLRTAGASLNFTASMLEATGISTLELAKESTLMDLGFRQDERQVVYQFEQTARQLLAQNANIEQLMGAYIAANQRVDNLRVEGETLLARRETLRQRAAAVISGYRTKDLTFRTFRNEALEQYRTLFDLASRYSYLAAKSYDYETGLLGTPQGQAVINRVVASRALGDLTNGVPQATTSTLGDAGLAGTLAQINADFSVAKGRLGINNPDVNGTLFSLRHELYRLLDDPNSVADDKAWQQTLEQNIRPDLMSDPDVVRYCNNIRKPDGSRVPGFVISFGTTIHHSNNFFGLPGAGGDHAYSPSNFATKISSSGLVFKGYVGMDSYSTSDGVISSSPDALRATPYVYLIPCGEDYMLAPPLGDTNTVRSWTVNDQALPLPYNLGASSFNGTNFFTANGTLSEQPWVLRKHQAFRPVNDPAFFYSRVPAEFTNRRLIARSVWNSKWKIVIPAYTLLDDEQEGMNRFVRSVKDIQLFLRTYSHSGN
jgi:hypothetical protein